MAVVDGDQIPTAEISGVITRLAILDEVELPHIAPEERTYVASEMNAFLCWWLWSLPCPVLNRPCPPMLTSPVWTPERWRLAAARIGVPVHAGEDEPGITITVVGGRCIGDASPCQLDRAKRFAAYAGVDALVVRFAAEDPSSPFLRAEPWPDIRVPAVAEAIVDHFARQSAVRSGQVAPS